MSEESHAGLYLCPSRNNSQPRPSNYTSNVSLTLPWPYPRVLGVVSSQLPLLQLATNEWIPSTNVLEGVVILTRNPELDDPPAGAAAGKEESKGATD